MWAYVVRRILATIPVLAIVALVVFSILHIAPGDPAGVIAGDQATEEQVQAIRAKLRLDLPFHEQFMLWLRQRRCRAISASRSSAIARWWRCSCSASSRPIALAVLTTIIAVTLAVPIGVLAAWRAGTAVDRGVMSFAVLGFSFPVFVIGYVLIYIFAIKLKLLPIQGYRPLADGFWPFLRHLILPSVALGLSFMALIARITRASVLEVLSQDHIRTARAKGLPPRRLLFGHALPNAAVPIVTIIGVGVALLLGGVVVTESVFAIPGVGRLVVDAILQRDYPVIQGVLLIFSATYVIVNLIIDLLYVVDRPAHPLLRRMADLAAQTETDLEAPARRRRSLAWHARRHPTVALGAAMLARRDRRDVARALADRPRSAVPRSAQAPAAAVVGASARAPTASAATCGAGPFTAAAFRSSSVWWWPCCRPRSGC